MKRIAGYHLELHPRAWPFARLYLKATVLIDAHHHGWPIMRMVDAATPTRS